MDKSQPPEKHAAAAAASSKVPAEPVTIIEFSPEGERIGPVTEPKVVLSEDEWRERLTAQAFAVTRHHDTEFAFTGKYNKNHAKGLYRCICCGTALFDSETKFDSGTGWPSFWEPIAEENVAINLDTSFGMTREEVLCARCDAHLGHRFPDGPEPTGQRYCMNSVALDFRPIG